MKDVIVTRHKYHIVRSLPGCTVRQEGANGTVIETTVPADEDTAVFAHSGRWAVEGDENVTVTEVFKLAPQQKLALLGVLGGNDGLPAGYTRVEYLQSASEVDNYQYVKLNLAVNLQLLTRIKATAENFQRRKAATVFATPGNLYGFLKNISHWRIDWGNFFNKFNLDVEQAEMDWFIDESRAVVNGVEQTLSKGSSNQGQNNFFSIGGFWYKETTYHGGIRIKAFSIFDSTGCLHDLIPCLTPTGAPCMFDIVSKTPFYNEGPGDFSYPGKEEEPATFSLRRSITYAQLTEHGVCRLYHVPKGYNGTKEEYAAEFGWKPLVETPQPEEGYWEPQWRETAEEIVLDWVETAPPMEESFS